MDCPKIIMEDTSGRVPPHDVFIYNSKGKDIFREVFAHKSFPMLIAMTAALDDRPVRLFGYERQTIISGRKKCIISNGYDAL